MSTNTDISALIEPLLKDTNIASDLQRKVKDVYSTLLDNLSKSAKGIKFETGTVNISSMLGVDQKQSLYTSHKYQSLQRTILDRVQKYVKTTESNIVSEGINLGTVLGTSQKESFLTSRKFQSIKKSILDRLQTDLGRYKGNIIGKSGINLGDILGGDQKTSILTSIKFQSLKRKVLKKLETDLTDKNLRLLSTGQLSIGDIMGEIPKMGLFERLKFRKLRSKMMTAIEKSVLGIKDDKLDKNGNKESGGLRIFEEEATPVKLVSIDDDILKNLSGVLGAGTAVTAVAGGVDAKPPAGLTKWIAPIIMIIASLGALATGLMSTGPAKGLMTMLGKVGIMASLKMVAKMVGKVLTKTLKWIPLVGTFVDLADAFMRFKNKDWAGGSIALVGGLLSLINLAAPGVGTALSLGCSALNAFLDFKAGGSSEEASVKKMDMIKDFLRPFGDAILPILKALPPVTLGIGLYKIAKGDVKEGFEAMAKSVSWIPVIGEPMARVASFLGERAQEWTEAKFGTERPLWESVEDYIVEKFKNALKRVIAIGTGIKEIFTGDVGKGFGTVISAVSDLDYIGPPLAKLGSFLQQKTENFNATHGEPGQPLWEKIRDYLRDKIQAAWKRLIMFGTGMLDVVKGDIPSAFDKFAQATDGLGIVGSVFNTLRCWMEEAEEEAPTCPGCEGTINFFAALKDIMVEKMSSAVQKLPRMVRFVLSKIPGFKEFVGDENFDNIGDEISDAIGDLGAGIKDVVGSKIKAGKDAVSEGWGKLKSWRPWGGDEEQGSPIPVNDFAGVIKPGNIVGSFRNNPIVNSATDYVIGAKRGGPIEQKLTELVESVNSNMKDLAIKISESIQSGVGNIQPAYIPIPPPAVNIPPPAPASIGSSKAPSYAMGSIYNQRARFYALYGDQ